MECLEQRIAPALLLFSKPLANSGQAQNLVTTDSSGNIFTAGVFTGTFDADPGPGVHNITSPNPNGDLFIAKYDADGQFLWAQTWIGSDYKLPHALLADSSGDVFVTGEYGGNGAYGFPGAPVLTATGGVDAFVLKMHGTDGSPDTAFDGDGQLTWGGTYNEFPQGLALDLAGNLLVNGSFDSFNAGYNGTGPLNANGITGFLLRLNAATGAPDNNFDGDGMYALPVSDQGIARVVVDGNNDLFLGIEDFNGNMHQIRKLNGADGAPVATFGNSGVVIPTAFASIAEGNFGMLIDSNGRLLVAETRSAVATTPAVTTITAFDPSTGAMDSSFNASGPTVGSMQISGLDTHSFTFTRDSNGHLYLGGVLENGQFFLQQVSRDGVVSQPAQIFGEQREFVETPNDLGLTIDVNDRLILRGAYVSAKADLDPTAGVLKVAPRADAVATSGMVEGFLTAVDPFGFNKDNPLVFNDFYGNPILVKIDGPGRAHYTFTDGDLSGADLKSLELFDTNLKTTVTITHKTPSTLDTTVAQIFTHGANQHVGSITLGPRVILGDVRGDSTTLIKVTGKLNSLTLDSVAGNSLIKLGEGLPYNVLGESVTPDTYNNHPDITIGTVLDDGLTIDVTGDGQPGGVGGGGLGKVTFGSWSYPGLIKTTQSIGDFTVKNGDFFGRLEIDKDHVGEYTQADVGTMTIANGSWGGSGTEIEGDVKGFDVEAFLAGASITAASIGTVKVASGDFEGTIVLTDPDSKSLPTFTISDDFTGTVVSANSIKKLNIKGDFTGSLEAPSIGAITAYAFLGTEGVTYIKTTAGPLGLLTATSGIVQNYDIITSYAFSGFNVKLAKITGDTAGIDNVHVTAASIGNIAVSLSAAASASDVDLVGIRNSTFVTMATGATKTTSGKIGNISVTLVGAAAGSSAIGIQNCTFDAQVIAEEFALGAEASTANTLGNITVKVTGSGGNSLGLENATFKGDTIGATKVSVSHKGAAATSHGVDTAAFTSTGAIGALTFDGDATSAQVERLKVWAGGKIGNVTVSALTTTQGSLVDSAILAGQSLDLSGATAKALTAALGNAGLGAVKASGSIDGTDLIAGASVGSITTGYSLTDSRVIAGAKLGGDFSIDGDESYQRAAAIAAVTVKGNYARTSLIAGIDPVNGVFGDEDDALAQTAGILTNSSSVGPLSFSAGPTPVAADGSAHHFAIQAAVIKMLKIGATPAVPSIASPLYLDRSAPGEDPDDLLVRIIG